MASDGASGGEAYKEKSLSFARQNVTTQFEPIAVKDFPECLRPAVSDLDLDGDGKIQPSEILKALVAREDALDESSKKHKSLTLAIVALSIALIIMLAGNFGLTAAVIYMVRPRPAAGARPDPIAARLTGRARARADERHRGELRQRAHGHPRRAARDRVHGDGRPGRRRHGPLRARGQVQRPDCDREGAAPPAAMDRAGPRGGGRMPGTTTTR